jgi:hypothetical protein
MLRCAVRVRQGIRDDSDGGARGGYTGIRSVPMRPLDTFLTNRRLRSCGGVSSRGGAVGLGRGSPVHGGGRRSSRRDPAWRPGAPLADHLSGLVDNGVLLVRAVRRARRLAGSRHRTAHTIAQNRGRSPTESAASRPGLPGAGADLAAVRRSSARARPAPPDRPAANRGSPDLAAAYVGGVAARVRDVRATPRAPPLRASHTHPGPRWPGCLGGPPFSSIRLRPGLRPPRAPVEDGPPVPPEPLWSSLKLTLVAPPTLDGPIASSTTRAAACGSSPAPASSSSLTTRSFRRAARPPRL